MTVSQFYVNYLQHRAASQDAFRHLTEALERPLVNAVVKITGNLEDAGDIVQETWAKLARKPPDDPRAVVGWLFRVARNAAFDRIEQKAPGGLPTDVELRSGDPRPDQVAANREVQRRAVGKIRRAAKSELDLVLALLLTGRAGHYEDEVVAEELGLSVPALRMAMSRLKNRLKLRGSSSRATVKLTSIGKSKEQRTT